jgi:hypothetical protein
MRPVVKVTSTVVFTRSWKQSLELKNARWMCVHEVGVRLSLGKRVPLGSLHEIL